MYRYIDIYIYTYIYIYTSICIDIYLWKTELTENCNFRFLLQTENGSLFSLVGKRLTVIDVCCFSRSNLWALRWAISEHLLLLTTHICKDWKNWSLWAAPSLVPKLSNSEPWQRTVLEKLTQNPAKGGGPSRQQPTNYCL
jgi:hypothetical protein